MKRIAVVAALVAASAAGVMAVAGGSGSVGLATLGTPYTQNFDALATTGTTNALSLNGWFLDEGSVTATANNGFYAAGTGSGNGGDTYAVGATAATDRALGGLRSGSVAPTIGTQFTNNTGSTVTALDVAYVGEMWRAGVTNRNAADRLDFQLSTNATSLMDAAGTWTDYSVLDFNSPTINATAGALDGNAAANRTSISATLTGLTIPSGSTFWIRWVDSDIMPGADDGLAVDDFSLTPRIFDLAPAVLTSYPTNGAIDFSIGANLSVTFTEPVDLTASAFTLNCTVSGVNVPTVVSGGPTTFTLNPTPTLTVGETCQLTVAATQVSDRDGNSPINMASDVVIGFTPFDACVAPFTAIPTIQGSGLSTPLSGAVFTRGIVTADLEGTAAASGFYLQDPIGDGNAATSDGIFVLTGAADLVAPGQLVAVSGFARERFDQTAITGANNSTTPVGSFGIVNCGSGAVTPTDVTLPFTDASFPERYEGMLVRFPQPLIISEYFNYDRFGEIVLGLPLDGEPRLFTPTSIEEPGSPALIARTNANALRRITLDDGLSAQNPEFLRHPNGAAFALGNLFRGGDQVQNAVGVLGYDFSLYRIYPTGPADFTPLNPRTTAPSAVGGTLRVAAMNTLNFFVTPDYAGGPFDNACGPAQSIECRGADFEEALEFTRQRDKLLAALAGLKADVIGLNEIENTAGVDPLGGPDGVVPGLNALLGADTYAHIDTGTIGTDAIRVGLIYKPAKVMPIGNFAVLTTAVDPRFIDTKSRPALAQTFEELATGSRFTIVVNHLKSKGSDCNDVGDPDIGDGQGNCNLTREKAAQALVDWLATDPTNSGDADFLIMGDLNSYAKEDPVQAIVAGADDTPGTADDFTNLVARDLGIYAYSYVFDGGTGYLDHALASAGLKAQVVGTAEWHINADEPDVVDYDTSFKGPNQEALYQPNGYRASDHDPVLVGLALKPTYADLCRLTGRLVTKKQLVTPLCDKLAEAEASEAAGDISGRNGSLRAYRNQLDAQSGKALTAANAAILKALSLGF